MIAAKQRAGQYDYRVLDAADEILELISKNEDEPGVHLLGQEERAGD